MPTLTSWFNDRIDSLYNYTCLNLNQTLTVYKLHLTKFQDLSFILTNQIAVFVLHFSYLSSCFGRSGTFSYNSRRVPINLLLTFLSGCAILIRFCSLSLSTLESYFVVLLKLITWYFSFKSLNLVHVHLQLT